jgi:cytochrome c oxidase cbb3-type subunit 2
MKTADRQHQSWRTGWRGAGLVVITYVYFLIFAQFAFLKRLAECGMAGDELKTIMGAMAAGGILASLLAYRLEGGWPAQRRLQLAFLGCATGSLLTLPKLNETGGAALAFLIGASVGLLTVTLVTHLRSWLGSHRPLLKIGLGTGLAYLTCNIPALFNAPPAAQAVVAAGLCALGAALAGKPVKAGMQPDLSPAPGLKPSFGLALLCFTALVWLDSAAFFIIQNTPSLKSGTWSGLHRLWLIGGIHLLAALASAGLLRRFGLLTTLSAALTSLGGACLLLAHPGRAPLAVVFYPLGVSLYSVALVAYPSFFADVADARRRARLAGALYAVAGWFGSGMGIGMAENLRRVPPAFVAGAALLFLFPWAWKFLRVRKRECSATGGLLLLAWGLQSLVARPATPDARLAPAERGRRIFISEGCMNCHSQYVRPGSDDVRMWGPASTAASVLAEVPPLIGNRRQGPDLAEIGSRRSALWLQAHFMDPSAVSPDSIMPGYAGLFARGDARGPALVAYLQSLGQTNLTDHYLLSATWQPAKAAALAAEKLDGVALVKQYCGTCHSPNGATRRTWKSAFKKLPPDFTQGPFAYVPPSADTNWRWQRFAEIIKFGLPGTDMPGHEYLPDAAVAAMARYLTETTAKIEP